MYLFKIDDHWENFSILQFFKFVLLDSKIFITPLIDYVEDDDGVLADRVILKAYFAAPYKSYIYPKWLSKNVENDIYADVFWYTSALSDPISTQLNIKLNYSIQNDQIFAYLISNAWSNYINTKISCKINLIDKANNVVLFSLGDYRESYFIGVQGILNDKYTVSTGIYWIFSYV